MHSDPERQFVRLVFDVSNKYPNWDPEVPVEVGDYGRITTGKIGILFWRRSKGTFLKEGNIYVDGLAEKFGIPPPAEHGSQAESDGVAWIVSENAVKIGFEGQLAP